MGKLKDSRHEKFTFLWHEGKSKSDAYRESHPSCAKWKDETVHNKAYALSKRGEILARFDELQEAALKGHNITIASLLKELDEARAAALEAETPQSSAAISATMNKAKLVGMDKHDPSVNVDITIRNTLDDFYS